MEVVVVRSTRRRRNVEAKLVDGHLQVSIPAWMSESEEARWAAEMLRRWERRSAADDLDLAARAAALAAKYRLPTPRSIRWVSNQHDRWGSYTPADGAIRLSDRMARFPLWVIDYVIVHELAHLVEHGHGRAFRALEARYPRSERAIGYLLAAGLVADRPPAASRHSSGGPWDQLPLFESWGPS